MAVVLGHDLRGQPCASAATIRPVAHPTSRMSILDAIESNFYTGWSNVGRWDRGELHEDPDATWYASAIPFMPYNAVIRSRFGPDAEARVDEILDAFRALDRDPIWIVMPTSTPQHLGAILEARGFSAFEAETCMAMQLSDLADGPTPDGCEVRPASSDDELDWYSEATAGRWGASSSLPLVTELHRYLIAAEIVRPWIATLHGKPVAKASTMLDGDVAGLYGVATLPEARGAGIGSALCATALRHARTQGATTAILHATPMAVRLYERLGFEPYGSWQVYASDQARSGG